MKLPEKLTVKWLRDAYLKGDTTPEKVVDECLKRASESRDMNIWIRLLSKSEIDEYLRALEEMDPASCPLWGIPFAVKDNIDLEGIPTTAACPDYTYQPDKSAEIIRRALNAGAVPIGKTNMDQFATGLVGTRSPFGEVHNSLRPELISGGSSAGSAVAVAMGQAAFSFGTDTAGSGRVPAALNELVGWKASVGAYPSLGVVPACISLDCVSVFANTAEDALYIDKSVRGICADDPWSKDIEMKSVRAPERVYIVDLNENDFFGPFASEYYGAWKKTVSNIEKLGIPVKMIDGGMFKEAASILYGGPLVAERWSDLGDFVSKKPESVFPVTKEVLLSGSEGKYSASDLFRAQHLLKNYRMETRKLLSGSVYITPTCTGTWTREQVRKDPINTNTDLGRFTNHCNLLDLCAAAVPSCRADENLPFGITAFGLSGNENLVAGFILAWKRSQEAASTVPLAVCGLHMRGMALEYQMINHGAHFVRETKTAAKYRMYAIPGHVERPGIIRVQNGGNRLTLEIWDMPSSQLGDFVQSISSPLCFGKVELEDGTEVESFLCESASAEGAREITAFGGYRNYLRSREAD